jgi:succinyl-CoA synthetase alpha subunit
MSRKLYVLLRISRYTEIDDTQERSAANAQQRRSYHTSRTSRRPFTPSPSVPSLQQKRSLHLPPDAATTLLASYNIACSPPPKNPTSTHYIGISPSRSSRSPSILAAPTSNPSQLPHCARRFPFDYRAGPSQATIDAALAHAQLDAAPPKARAQTVQLVRDLWRLYTANEATDTHVSLAVSPSADALAVYNAHLLFDDAAFNSNGRHAALHSLASAASSAPDPDAAAAGIVYIPLASAHAALVGTLVNGAGLAMNTVDVLARRLPHTAAANFLDTGGKATASTIATSFKLILGDARVRVVFVNIFGGLTRCDMIAEGIVLAFKDVGVRVPVVVRLRGTNEGVGQEVLRRAGLAIEAVEDFEEAVQRVGELVKEAASKT